MPMIIHTRALQTRDIFQEMKLGMKLRMKLGMKLRIKLGMNLGMK